MNENKFQKLFLIGAFIAFAGISCWATSESLHLLLPTLPLMLCWIITIGFFVIASIGSKMVVDSLNQNIYLEKRGLHLFGGILILIVFWLICSMPTNTHTFFFRSVIDAKISDDVAMTQNYLNQIQSDVVTQTMIKAKQTELRNNVEMKLGELKAEIMNDANPGFGPKSKEILNDFAALLNVPQIQPLTYKGIGSIQERERLYNAYREKMYLLLDNRLLILAKELTPPNDNHIKQAKTDYDNLELIKRYIENEQLDVNDAVDIATIAEKLNVGYSTIKSYSQFVDFKNDTDRANYLSNNPITKVKRMISVFDVWTDFLKGEYAGHGFLFWVIISILVDIAAFIFFTIAFKKTDY